ncbi:hypothetical protein [Streptomyces sp. NBC_01750]|uniref:hypothetical protein n=1 Tax=Streptomyces sp. NBC_01750 TaxID=2975928 RepID=UPI002DDAE468|nr:hypothetical protein [Streptomyces sp. NBC_01750]WSD38078.1 hypothetical protein OG966_34910 [Streptomyces sp. NBC_01750]
MAVMINMGMRIGTASTGRVHEVCLVARCGLHGRDEVLTPAQVTARIAAHRAAGPAVEDTVPGGR